MALPTETRATLLLRIRDPKNTEAWREFITIYEPLIAGVAGRLGLQSADADELVQEVFLVVLEKQHLYKPSGESASFRRWLGTVARNAAITRLRKKANACSAIGGTDSIRKLDLAVDPLSPADEFDRLYEMEERPTPFGLGNRTSASTFGSSNLGCVLEDGSGRARCQCCCPLAEHFGRPGLCR